MLSYFDTRFGIPLPTFDAYDLLERRHVFIVLSHSARITAYASLKVQNTGLPVLRKVNHHLKPTTAALQRFGSHARRNIVSLTSQELVSLLQHSERPWPDDSARELTPGYVVLRVDGHVVGCGLYTPGRLRSQIPKWQVQHQHL